MPAKSKSQFRLMQAVAHGGLKKTGLSPARAREFVNGQSSKGLSEKKSKRHRVRYPSPSRQK